MAQLDNFFNPKTIALIGASDNFNKVGGILCKKLSNFKGKLIPINPNHSEILGLRCYKSLEEYKDKIDLAIIAIPKEFVASSLEECGKKQITSVIIISAGFAEIGNITQEKELIQIAEKYKIKFLGPNCFGVFSPDANIDSTFAKTTPEKGNIAFISQSGALWSWVSDYPSDKWGFSGFASLGNMASLGFSEFIEYFSKDKNTKSIILYMEKLKDGKKFLEVCKKTKKKIYVIKAGKSEQGLKAAFSHTGSLATDYKIYMGAFKQANIEICSDILEAFEKASKKNINKKKQTLEFDKSVLVITNAGGVGALTTDYLNAKDIKVIGPIDILGAASSEDYKKALEDNKDKSNQFIIIATPQKMTNLEDIANEIIKFEKSSKKKIIVIFTGDKSVKKATDILIKNNIPVFNELTFLL